MPAMRVGDPIAEPDLVALATQADTADQFGSVGAGKGDEKVRQQSVVRPIDIDEALADLCGQGPRPHGRLSR